MRFVLTNEDEVDVVVRAIEQLGDRGVESQFGPTRELRGVEFMIELDCVGDYDVISHSQRIVIDAERRSLLEILRKDPTSRQAVVYIGGSAKEVFCLQLIQVLVRDGELDAFCYARSLDVRRKFPADTRVVANLATSIAFNLELTPGLLRFYAASAHVYTDASSSD